MSDVLRARGSMLALVAICLLALVAAAHVLHLHLPVSFGQLPPPLIPVP